MSRWILGLRGERGGEAEGRVGLEERGEERVGRYGLDALKGVGAKVWEASSRKTGRDMVLNMVAGVVGEDGSSSLGGKKG